MEHFGFTMYICSRRQKAADGMANNVDLGTELLALLKNFMLNSAEH